MQYKHHIALLLSALTLATAQGISSLPACATAGALAAIGSSGCASTDIACICGSKYFTSGLEQYAKQNCSAQDYTTAITVGQTLCAQAGITIDSSSSAVNAAGTAPATAGDPLPTTMATSMSDPVSTPTAAATTVCGCEGDMPTSVSSGASGPVATFTGAAARVGGGIGGIEGSVVVGGLVGALGMLGML